MDTVVHGGLGGAAFANAAPKGCSAGASGTIHWTKEDALMIHNKNIMSSMKTVIAAKLNRDKEHYPSQSMIAHDLMINSAHLEIRNTKMKSLLMPYLDMVGKSSIFFNLEDTRVFLLRYR